MDFIAKLKSYLHFQKGIVESVKTITEWQTINVITDLRYQFKYDELTEKALNCTDEAVVDELYGNSPLIVSLTTHGKRISDVHVAIESIMQGSLKPNKIILWISEEYKKQSLPITLQRQTLRGLEIEYCRDVRSYTKLLPALQKYPNASIVTIDDDIIYPYDMLESLVNAHLEDPDCICANSVRDMPVDLMDNYVPLLDWPVLCNVDRISEKLFYEGFAGVLYPSCSFDSEVFNEDVFLDICKYADDVWFNAMSLMNGTKVKYAWKHYGKIPLLGNPKVQVVALSNVNCHGEVLNDKQVNDVYTKYGLFEKLKCPY